VYPDWTLQYFEAKDSLEPKGLVDFNDIDEVRRLEAQDKYKYSLGLHTKGQGGRVWKFACDTEEELDSWLKTFDILMKDKYQFAKWNSLSGDTEVPAGGNTANRSYSTASAASYMGPSASIGSFGGNSYGASRNEEKIAEYKDEIDRLQTTIVKQEETAQGFRKQIESVEKQLQEHQGVVKQASKDILSMLKDMKKSSAAQKVREDDLKEKYETTKKQFIELSMRNEDLESLLKNNNLNVVQSPRIEPKAFRFDEDDEKSRIISGTLDKFGNAGGTRAKAKHVLFVAVGKYNFVEWSDRVDSEKAKRMQIIGVSTDVKLIRRQLSKDEKDRVFVLRGAERVAVFMARDKAQRDDWLKFAKECRVIEVCQSTVEI